MEKIAVLCGGCSNEREVSLASGDNVAKALASLGCYLVTKVVLDADNLSALPPDTEKVYIALHGGWGENGGIQRALDKLKIPYTGPGALSSEIAMDKLKTKMVLELKGVPTAAWGLAEADTAQSPLPLPVVVKPPCDGSSVGITKVSDATTWPQALAAGFKAMGDKSERRQLLVEEFIPGREFTVPVLNGKAWDVVEIITASGWYGYDEKYNSTETRYPFYGDDPTKLIPACPPTKLQQLAVEAYKALNCRGITRVDFRVSPLGRAYVLELNTSPGFTSHSLVPKAGMRSGRSFAEVCEAILATARHD